MESHYVLVQPISIRMVDSVISQDALKQDQIFPMQQVNNYSFSFISKKKKIMMSSQTDFCSHQKSVYYYAKSVSLSHGAFPFYAVSTNSWQYFINHVNINYKNTVKMGIDCPPTARGKYYLQTTDLPQMSLGNYGTYYHSDQT